MSQRLRLSEYVSDLHSPLFNCYLIPTQDNRRDCLQALAPTLSRRDRSLSPPTKNTIQLPTLQDSLDYDISTSCTMTSRSTTLSPSSELSLENSDTDGYLQHVCPESSAQPEGNESDMESLGSQKQKVHAISHELDYSFDSITERQTKRRRETSPSDAEDGYGESVEEVEDSQEEQDTNSDADHDIPQELEDLLEEAHRFYGDKKPEFCIGHPEEKARIVKLADSSTTTTLLFCTWLGGLFGYWLLTSNGERHIVKHIRGRYYVWQGLDDKFTRDPIAFAFKGGHQHAVSIGDLNLLAEASPVRNFRNRTLKQEKPYSIYNAQKKIEDKGDTATESQLELAVTRIPPIKETPKRKAVTRIGSKKRKLSTPVLNTSRRSISLISNLTSLPETPSSPSRHSISNDRIADNAVLRTRLDSIGGPSIAVFLKDIRNCVDLFEKLEAKWTFRLSDNQIRYCIAHFDWLNNDKSILMQENDEDGFQLLLDEIRRAPAWQKGEQINVALELHAA